MNHCSLPALLLLLLVPPILNDDAVPKTEALSTYLAVPLPASATKGDALEPMSITMNLYPHDIWFTITDKVSPGLKFDILLSASTINQYAVRKLKYCPVTPCSGGVEPYVIIDMGKTCNAGYVGYRKDSNPTKVRIQFNTKCLGKPNVYRIFATIMHEFMHVYGFVHEQQRFDRDDYIVVNWRMATMRLAPYQFVMYTNNKANTVRPPLNVEGSFDVNSWSFYHDDMALPLKANVKLPNDPNGTDLYSLVPFTWDWVKLNRGYGSPLAEKWCEGKVRNHPTSQVIQEENCDTGEELFGSLQRICLFGGIPSGHKPICLKNSQEDLLYCNFENMEYCDKMFSKPIHNSWQVLEAYDVGNYNLTGDFTYISPRLNGKVMSYRKMANDRNFILASRWLPLSGTFCLEYASFIAFKPEKLKVNLMVYVNVRPTVITPKSDDFSWQSYTLFDQLDATNPNTFLGMPEVWKFNSFLLAFNEPPETNLEISFSFEAITPMHHESINFKAADPNALLLDNVRIHRNGDSTRTIDPFKGAKSKPWE